MSSTTLGFVGNTSSFFIFNSVVDVVPPRNVKVSLSSEIFSATSHTLVFDGIQKDVLDDLVLLLLVGLTAEEGGGGGRLEGGGGEAPTDPLIFLTTLWQYTRENYLEKPGLALCLFTTINI